MKKDLEPDHKHWTFFLENLPKTTVDFNPKQHVRNDTCEFI